MSPTDLRLSWEGLISLEKTDSWTMPWRIPESERRFFDAGNFLEMAAHSTGVRLRLRSDTCHLQGEFEGDALANLDLLCNGKLVSQELLSQSRNFQFGPLPSGMNELELWLPHNRSFRLRYLEVDADAECYPWPDQRPRWIAYGSSITHSVSATSPTQTWVSAVALRMGWSATNLGYSGNCHMEPMVALMIRDLPADILTLCIGVNIHGASSTSSRSFIPAIIGFIRILREKHPTTPIYLISPIFASARETMFNAVGMTLSEVRSQVEEAAKRLTEEGDTFLSYIDGLDLLGPGDYALIPDGVHPSEGGYIRLIDRLLPMLNRIPLKHH